MFDGIKKLLGENDHHDSASGQDGDGAEGTKSNSYTGRYSNNLSGRRGGRGGGGGGGTCFNCGGDHMARECDKAYDSQSKFRSSSGRTCFNCGGGHMAKDCPEEYNPDSEHRPQRREGGRGRGGGGRGRGAYGGGRDYDRPRTCFNCGGGHMAKDCPEEYNPDSEHRPQRRMSSGYGGGRDYDRPRTCFNCGGGHMAKDCPEEYNPDSEHRPKRRDAGGDSRSFGGDGWSSSSSFYGTNEFRQVVSNQQQHSLSLTSPASLVSVIAFPMLSMAVILAASVSSHRRGTASRRLEKTLDGKSNNNHNEDYIEIHV